MIISRVAPMAYSLLPNSKSLSMLRIDINNPNRHTARSCTRPCATGAAWWSDRGISATFWVHPAAVHDSLDKSASPHRSTFFVCLTARAWGLARGQSSRIWVWCARELIGVVCAPSLHTRSRRSEKSTGRARVGLWPCFHRPIGISPGLHVV